MKDINNKHFFKTAGVITLNGSLKFYKQSERLKEDIFLIRIQVFFKK